AGRTPNPCVLCNTHIKWSALIKRARQMDCELIATGHYAQTREEKGRFVISKGVDDWKDQSYVLWGLAQENLAISRFPLGGFHKKDIRKMCMEWGYTDLAKKSESYEICFIPDNDYRGFLKRRVPELEEKVSGGKFVNTKGEVVGTHEGYPFFTIGQRKGLGIALGKPMFVTGINAENNTVVLGEEDDLRRSGMTVGGINFQKYAAIEDGMKSITKVRYKDAGSPGLLYNDGKKVRVEFDTLVKGIAPGQSAVFYEGNDVIGGGIIHSSFNL
ncbi:MAG: tRNA 2-thiouridine(34) synthase MnmA, partial [Chitinophagales bacterium]